MSTRITIDLDTDTPEVVQDLVRMLETTVPYFADNVLVQSFGNDPGEVSVFAHLTVSRDDFEQGWAGSTHELEGTVRARLGELLGDDGGSYAPLNDVHAQVQL